MTSGVCPFATFYGDSDGCYGAVCENRPALFVDHTMVGWKRTLDGPWRRENRVIVHFGIGRDGSVSQYRSIFESHYGNGVHNPSALGGATENPYLAALVAGRTPIRSASGGWFYRGDDGANLLNTHSVSFEHEDGGDPSQPWTEALLAATIAVKRWCLEEMNAAGRGFATFDPARLAGHFEIDPVNKGGCPGPAWPRERIVAALMLGESASGGEGDAMTPEQEALLRSVDARLTALEAEVYYGVKGVLADLERRMRARNL